MLTGTVNRAGRSERLSDFLEYLTAYPGGGTAVELARALGLHRRSIYRYCEKAGSYGHVVDHVDGVFRLRSPDRPPPERDVTLTDDEIQVLLAATPSRQHSPTLRAALAKLRAAQNPHGQKRFADVPPIYLAGQDTLPDGLLDRALHAIRVRKTARVDYCNASGLKSTHLFDAYGIIQRREHLYVVGVIHAVRDAGQTNVSLLRMDSVQSWNLTLDRFPDPDFDLRGYAQRSFGAFAAEEEGVMVRLLVSAEKAHAVARTTRHPSQKCTLQADGTLLYELCVPLSVDLVSWVVGYAGHVQVLEPPALREQVLKHAHAVLVRHDAVTSLPDHSDGGEC